MTTKTILSRGLKTPVKLRTQPQVALAAGSESNLVEIFNDLKPGGYKPKKLGVEGQLAFMAKSDKKSVAVDRVPIEEVEEYQDKLGDSLVNKAASSETVRWRHLG